MRKIRILQTPVRFFPYVGGVEKYVLNLSQELVKRGHSVKVVCANEPKSDLTKIDGINIQRLDYVGKITNTNITLGLFFALLKEDFDIIHTHFPTPWSADISMIVSYLKNKPLIVTYHNDVTKKGFFGILTEIYNKTFLQLILNRAAKIIITQPGYLNTSKYLMKFKDKIVVLPNGIQTNRYHKNHIRKKSNQVFFLSVLDKYHEYKGLDYLINAICDVKKEIPNVKLIVGGKGELIEKYRSLTSEMSLNNNIEFKGYIEDKKLVDLYNQSAIFVLPSIGVEEGFGIVLLEALACETPVIATNIVGIANDIKLNNAGLIVKPKNSKELAFAIKKIIKDKKLQSKMGKNGRNVVLKYYDWKIISKSIERIYMEVLK